VEVEVPPVEQRVSAVAAAVSARAGEVSDDIVALLMREISPLDDDQRVVGLLSASVAENVATLLHALEHGIDPERIEAPAAAIEYARRLAQRGVPVVALVRAYRIGQARFLQWCFDELGSEGSDGPVRSEAARRMTERSFTYIDRVSEQVISVYEQERDRWLNNRATVRAARVRAILAGHDVDVDVSESTIGYRLRRRHLGMVAWVRERTRGDDDLVLLERTAATIALGAGSPAKPLFIPCDEASAWVWFPLHAEGSPADAVAAATPEGPVRVALGEPADGIDGFCTTHRQALLAQTVALAAGPAGRLVTAFADIRPLALMASDIGAVRAWVLDTLGELTVDDEPHERLRTTLRVFLSTGGSYTATADRLMMHKNTVLYRVNRAEEIRGRSFHGDRLDVELALLACEQLGATVLQPAPA
jgi:PucR-like helix-turn-helix protein/diguanylate cyclase with GGDEF domain